MANTLEYIADNTVSGATVNTITFSSIPQTYKDLYLIGSILTDPGNTGAFLEIFPDDGAGGWPTAYGSTTRFYSGPTGSLGRQSFPANWRSRYVGGYLAGETGPCYFEWTLHNYTTSTAEIAGFNQIGWSSFDSGYQEQYMGGHSVDDGYSTTTAPGPVTNLKLEFTATYLAVGTKITLYGIGS